MRARLAPVARAALVAANRVLGALGPSRAVPSAVAYVVERANWSIRWDGYYYARGVEKLRPGTVTVTDAPARQTGRVVHFGSQFHWALWDRHLARHNRAVVTYFHGKPEDGPHMARQVERFLGGLDRIERVVTAATGVEANLLSWGVPAEKLRRVPLGVDLELFRAPLDGERAEIRARLGVPEDAVCIGSFQKDGVGWGQGMQPKTVKGPDVFIDAARILAADFPVFVLLTGPARGYVMNGLARAGVPFSHVFLTDYRDIAAYYRALDLYLVTSREEGGPKAVLESMASGVPILSTPVGMAPDVIADGANGGLVPVGDAAATARAAAALLGDPAARESRRREGLKTAAGYGWDDMARILLDDVYTDLLP